MMEELKILKGGSLSKTSVCEIDGQKFVRKKIDRQTSREYGFIRWYSQVKKIQRLNKIFPHLFPKIYDINCDSKFAYCDLEFFEFSEDLKTILSSSLEFNQINSMVNKLCEAFEELHCIKYNTYSNISNLYYFEEINQKLIDALKYKSFAEFTQFDEIIFNGKSIKQIFRGLCQFA